MGVSRQTVPELVYHAFTRRCWYISRASQLEDHVLTLGLGLLNSIASLAKSTQTYIRTTSRPGAMKSPGQFNATRTTFPPRLPSPNKTPSGPPSYNPPPVFRIPDSFRSSFLRYHYRRITLISRHEVRFCKCPGACICRATHDPTIGGESGILSIPAARVNTYVCIGRQEKRGNGRLGKRGRPIRDRGNRVRCLSSALKRG